jgi:MFS family permease
MKRLARHRDFRLLFAGHVTSLFGDRALFVVLGIWALELTGSTAAGAIAFGSLALAGFLAPAAGVIADRFPRRQVLIGNDLATAVMVLALLFVNDSGDVWIIYVVALAYGFSQQVAAAARSGLVAGMLPDDLLPQANGVLESARSGIRIIAPVAGAGLYVLSGGGLVALVDAGTFLISACALALVRAPDIARAKRGRVGTGELLAGFRHFFSTPVLRAILPAVVLGAGGVGLAEVIPFAVVHDGLHQRGAFLGVMGAFHGAGAIAGGLGVGRFIDRIGEVRSLALALTLGAGGMACYSFATIPSALLASLLFGCCLAGVIVCWTTLIQRRTPGELLGRAAAAGEALASIPYVGAIGLGAAIVTMVDYRALSAVAAVGFVIASVYLTRAPVLRESAHSHQRARAAATSESA